MIKKIFSKILALLLILSFSGCSLSPFGSSGIGQITKEKKKEIVVWNLFDDTDVFKGQIQDFESKNPGVKIIYKKFNDKNSYEELLFDEMAEGRGPDIFTLSHYDLDKHIGKIFPLEIGKDQMKMSLEKYKNDFLPSISNALIRSGKIYGVSLYIDTLALFYNKKIYSDHFASGKPDDTWEKFSYQVEQMSKQNNSIEGFSLSGVGMGRGDNIKRFQDILYLLMLQYSGDFYNEKTGKINFANENQKYGDLKNISSKYALEFYTSFATQNYKNYSWNDRMTAKFDDKSEVFSFVSGKTATIFGYSYLYEDVKKIISDFKSQNKESINIQDVGISEVPQILSFNESGKRDSIAMFYPLFVSKNSKNQDIAWNFILHLSTKESIESYTEKTNKAPSRKDLIEEQKFSDIYGVFSRQAIYSKVYPNFVADEKKYFEIFKNLVDGILKAKILPKEGIIQAQNKIQCLVDKNKDKQKNLDKVCDLEF